MADPDFEVEWVGAYDSGFRKVGDKIEDMQIMPDGKVVGGGDDMKGDYKITGDYTASKNQLEFYKEYEHSGKGAHYKGQLVGPNFEGQRSVGNQGHQRCTLRMNHEEWRGYFKEERGRSGNAVAYLYIYQNQISGHGFMNDKLVVFKGEKTGRTRVQFLASNLYTNKNYNCRGEMTYIQGVMAMRGTVGGKSKGQFEFRKYTRDPTDQEAIKHLPPTYNSSATDMITNKIYNQKAKTSNLFKNPKWQEMFNSGPDVLGPNIRMVPINKETLFTPDTEDVINMENEVNYYRNQRMRKEDELNDLERQKLTFIEDIRREKEAEKAEDLLDELDEQVREKDREAEELERRKRELEEKRQILMSKMHEQSHQTLELDQYPQPIQAGGFGSHPGVSKFQVQEPLKFYKEAPGVHKSPGPITILGQNPAQHIRPNRQPAQRFQQPFAQNSIPVQQPYTQNSIPVQQNQGRNFMRDSFDQFSGGQNQPMIGNVNNGFRGGNSIPGRVLPPQSGTFNGYGR